MRNHDELVRERAYALWEQAGCPEDRALEFWFAAVSELEETAPAVHVVEQVVLAAEPERVALRPAEKPAA